MNRIALAVICAASVAACSSDRYLMAEGGEVTMPPATATNDVTAPEPGANPPMLSGSIAAGGPEAYNSDNRPIVTRSGLNGDANNPSGAPGRPWAWNSL